MDCEKFDNVMLDELYGELDELTSASAKRHLSGCARCTAAFAGMKATRRVAVLPLVDPPVGLEEKIFARVKEAQKVVPFRARAIRFVSLAGSWAMRPQTAMAAVFLLMVGSSVLFMHASKKDQGAASETVRVSDQPGSPMPFGGVPAGESKQRMDYAAAASAHGTEPPKLARPSAQAAPAEKEQDESEQQQLLAKREATQDPAITNAGGAGGAPMPAPTTAMPPQSQVAPGVEQKATPSTDYERGLAQYRDKKYDDAVKTLDGVSGSPDAALWSARAMRDSKGCGAAVQKFDDLMSRTFGTNAGYEATFDAAKCYEAIGRTDIARARYSKLLSVPQWAVRAQNELDRLRPLSAKPAAPMRSEDKANGY